jgi:hypothetical protein
MCDAFTICEIVMAHTALSKQQHTPCVPRNPQPSTVVRVRPSTHDLHLGRESCVWTRTAHGPRTPRGLSRAHFREPTPQHHYAMTQDGRRLSMPQHDSYMHTSVQRYRHARRTFFREARVRDVSPRALVRDDASPRGVRGPRETPPRAQVQFFGLSLQSTQ